MQLNELDNFSLSDAVFFHDELNPAIFAGDHMKYDVREQLLHIAEDFVEHLGIPNIDIADITISGSSAAYSYTKYSDIDLHILVDMNKFSDDDVYRELFDAKKVVYNDQHDIVINGYEVELYVQDTNQPVISLGEYSVMNDKWIKLPRKRRAHLDQAATKAKFEKLYKLSEYAVKSKNLDKIQQVLKTIKKYRQAGLDVHGEFGPENLAFKAIRSKGIIKRLYNLVDELHSKKLSIPESVVIKKVKNDTLVDSLSKEFTKFKTGDYDGIEISLEKENDEIMVTAIANGKKLGQVLFVEENGYLLPQDLEVDERYRNQGIASTMYDYVKSQGYKIRRSGQQTDAGAGFWGKHRPEQNIWEASGYIPSESEKNDPRWERALSVDVHPDTMKKQAKKFGWKISRAGIPPLLRK